MCDFILPMTSFCLKGSDGYIKLIIDKIYGFPDSISWAGGYDVKGVVQISVGGYKVDSQNMWL